MQGNLSESSFSPSLINATALVPCATSQNTKETPPSVTLARHLRKNLRIYGYVLPPVTALVVSLGLGWTAFHYKSLADLELLQSIEEEVAEVLVNDDSHDLDRLLRSVRDEGKSELLILEETQIIASSHPEHWVPGIPFRDPKFLNLSEGVGVSVSQVITQVPIQRRLMGRSYSMVMVAPLKPILSPILLIALAVLVVGFLISRVYAFKLVKCVTNALEPVSKLDHAIRSLPNLESVTELEKTGIKELDSIAGAVIFARREIANARDIQAKAEAQRLVAFEYQTLIHDLHTSIATLGNFIAVMNDPETDEATREKTSYQVADLATQILMQVKADKAHLNFDQPSLQKQDLLVLVEDSIRNAVYSSEENQKKTLNKILPKHPIPCVFDANHLRRAITNLVHNALAAAKSTVEVSLHEKDGGFRILVSDDGPGMKNEDIVFYFQGRKKSTKEDRPAYGLAASHHIISLLGGNLIYQQSHLGGACFEIQLKDNAWRWT